MVCWCRFSRPEAVNFISDALGLLNSSPDVMLGQHIRPPATPVLCPAILLCQHSLLLASCVRPENPYSVPSAIYKLTRGVVNSHDPSLFRPLRGSCSSCPLRSSC